MDKQTEQYMLFNDDIEEAFFWNDIEEAAAKGGRDFNIADIVDSYYEPEAKATMKELVKSNISKAEQKMIR